jgi:hypothetical protein
LCILLLILRLWTLSIQWVSKSYISVAVHHAAEQAQKPAGSMEDEEQVPPSKAAETGKSGDEEGRLEAGAAAVAQVDAKESVSSLSESCIKTETRNETD